MAKEPIKYDEGRRLLRNLAMTPEGPGVLDYLFQLMGDGGALGNSDVRKQERNVALHDLAVEIREHLEP